MAYEYQAVKELDAALNVSDDDWRRIVALVKDHPEDRIETAVNVAIYDVVRPRLFALVARLAGIPIEETTDHVEVFRQLAELSGGAFDDVDPDQLVAEMRYDSPFSEDQIRAMLRHASIHPRERFGDAGERGR